MTFRYQYGAGSNAYETLNPATPSELLGRYGIPDETEISKIFDRANTAQAEWARVPGLEPGERLNAFLDAVVARADDIAESVTLEQGKLLAEAKGETIRAAPKIALWWAKLRVWVVLLLALDGLTSQARYCASHLQPRF